MTVRPSLAVKVWGDFACFTRPEFKVERVTYPVMTPSAARGLLEAIFWKPEFRWRVQAIDVLTPPRYFSIRRNEVAARASDRSDGLLVTEQRTQRHALVLRDVVYVIYADAIPKSGSAADEAKYRDQFRRRLERGACAHRPYLGTREFAAEFAPPGPDDGPPPLDLHVGTMLLDVEYASDRSGRGQPYFFDAWVREGRLKVPPIPWEA